VLAGPSAPLLTQQELPGPLRAQGARNRGVGPPTRPPRPAPWRAGTAGDHSEEQGGRRVSGRGWEGRQPGPGRVWTVEVAVAGKLVELRRVSRHGVLRVGRAVSRGRGSDRRHAAAVSPVLRRSCRNLAAAAPCMVAFASSCRGISRMPVQWHILQTTRTFSQTAPLVLPPLLPLRRAAAPGHSAGGQAAARA